ncbi:hypothetical protein KY312_02895 [Candidatus Woesearchaeota archaeon]|nr:hypothetical protein [Candidatus Woesearchaeota archaeon]
MAKKRKTSKKVKKVRRRRAVKVKKKSRWKLKLGFFLTLLLVGFGLFIFYYPMPYETVEIYTIQEPYEDIEFYTENEVREDCISRNYNFEADWDPLQPGDSEEGYISNRVKIANLENLAGDFELKIYYFDVTIHPIANQAQYTLEDADMVSYSRIVKVDANSEASKLVRTRMQNEFVGYWSRYEVIPSILQDCDQVLVPVTRAKTTTKYNEIEKTRNVTKYAPLVDIWLRKVKLISRRD